MTGLVDPTADRRAPRRLAPGVTLARARVGLVDSTLNKRAQWGSGMLDAAEAALRRAGVRATEREAVNPVVREDGERWAARMARTYEALVIATGDCITCSSRSVRDAVIAEELGVPAVLIHTGGVTDVVRSACSAHRLPDLRRIAVQTSLFGRSRAEIAALVTPLLPPLAALIEEGR